MSSLEADCISNAGLTCRLLTEQLPSPRLSVFYESGIQWQEWRQTGDVITGRGLNRQIRRAYGFLASRYRPGDRIFLIGYSRGAYGARSLAGLIDRVGLLRHDAANVRNIRVAWRYYQLGGAPETVQAFQQAHCHEDTDVEMVGVWDTVKALGLRLPVVWRFTEPRHAFHNHLLGAHIRHGFQALALDETRNAYAPVLWHTPDSWNGHVEQMWFRGSHGDVGGHLLGVEQARPLSNIPLVWMLERAETCGLPLPAGWRQRFPCDVEAPSVGTWRGWNKIFLSRTRRVVGSDRSERIHPTARDHVRRARIPLRPGAAARVLDDAGVSPT